MPLPPRIHNLRHNAGENSPPRWVFFDTETTWCDDGQGGELHTLRCWAARLDERAGPSRATPRADRATGTTVATMADYIEAGCRPSERLWMCAHNLGFDLAVTQLPMVLAERGWEVTQHALTGSSPWMRLRRRHSTLTLVDSHSWLPHSLDDLGVRLGLPKLPLPAWDASLAEWTARCAQDVDILAVAMLQLLDWWDQRQLGHWSLTGPATGFNAYRHTAFRTPVVIDPDQAARDLERAAVYGGRAEVWRVGRQAPGQYVMVDFAHAFASVCAHLPLPRRRGDEFDGLALDDRILRSRTVEVMAQCEVQTDTPRYPLRTRAGIVHPVGRFVTLLCGPEIREARDRGELRAIGPGRLYLTSHHMADWARWAVEVIEGRADDAPPMAQVAVKGWTRTVPGRWAGRTGRVDLTLEQPIPGWRMTQGRQHPGNLPITTLDMGGRRYRIVHDVDMDNAFPAVLAFVQSHVRVQLGRLVDLVGEDAAVSCNTDGLVVDLDAWCWSPDCRRRRHRHDGGRLPAFAAWLSARLAQLAPLEPVIKGEAATVEVLSPQHLIVGRDRRLSGVPRSALDMGGHVYAFTDWPRLASQLEGDVGAGYHRRRRLVDLSTVPVLRWRATDGRCWPVEAAGTLGGPTTLLPFVPGRTGPHGAVLGASQHPALPAPAPAAAPEAVA